MDITSPLDCRRGHCPESAVKAQPIYDDFAPWLDMGDDGGAADCNREALDTMRETASDGLGALAAAVVRAGGVFAWPSE